MSFSLNPDRRSRPSTAPYSRRPEQTQADLRDQIADFSGGHRRPPEPARDGGPFTGLCIGGHKNAASHPYTVGSTAWFMSISAMGDVRWS